MLAGCPQLRTGSGSPAQSGAAQTQGNSTGSSAASTGISVAPKLDRSIERELPLDSSFTIESLSGDLSSGLDVRVSSSMDALKTATFLLGALGGLGYESDDNASRILEGVTLTKQQGRVHTLYVKVDLGSDDVCRVTLKAHK